MIPGDDCPHLPAARSEARGHEPPITVHANLNLPADETAAIRAKKLDECSLDGI
jgi:hypothetical protein